MDDIYKRAIDSVVEKYINPSHMIQEYDSDNHSKIENEENEENAKREEYEKRFLEENATFNSIVQEAITAFVTYINNNNNDIKVLVEERNKLVEGRKELEEKWHELQEPIIENVEEKTKNFEAKKVDFEAKKVDFEAKCNTFNDEIWGKIDEIWGKIDEIWEPNKKLFNPNRKSDYENAYVFYIMKGVFTNKYEGYNIDTLKNYYIILVKYIIDKKNLNFNPLLKSLERDKTEVIEHYTDSQTIPDTVEMSVDVDAYDTIIEALGNLAYLIQKPIDFKRHVRYHGLEKYITNIFTQKQHSVKTALKNGSWDPVNNKCDRLHWCIHNFINQATDLMHDVEKNGWYIAFLIEILTVLIRQIESSSDCEYSNLYISEYKRFLAYLNEVYDESRQITQTRLHQERDTFFQIFINYPKLEVFKLNYKEPVPIEIDECYHEIMSEILNRFEKAFIYHESGRIPTYLKLKAFYEIKKNRNNFFEKYPQYKSDPNPDLLDIIESRIKNEEHIIQNHVSHFDAAPRTKTKKYNTTINEDGVYEIDEVLCKFKYTIQPFGENNYLVKVYEETEQIAEFSFKKGVPINMLLNHVGITTSRQGNGESGSINTLGETMEELRKEGNKRKIEQEGNDHIKNNENHIFYKDPDQEAKNQLLLFLNKTLGDILSYLFENVMKYSFTVDSLYAHSIYMRFIRNEQDHCPTIYRQIANGFIKYFGLEIIDAELKATQILNKIITMYYFRNKIISQGNEDEQINTNFTFQLPLPRREKNFHLDRITQIWNVYEKSIPEIIETLVPQQDQENPYRAIMLLLQIAEADYIKTKLNQYNTDIQNLFVGLDMDNFFEGIKTKGFDFFESVSTMPDLDYFEPRINKHAIIQEAHENHIIDNILGKIPVDSWELHFEEPNIHFIWVMGKKVDPQDRVKINELGTLSTTKKDVDNLDNVKYDYFNIKGDTDNRKHSVTIPITLDVLLQLYNHNHRSIINDQEKKKKIRENIDMMITTIVETSIKGYNQIDLVQERIKQLLDHIHTKGTSPVPLSISKTLHGNLSSATQTLLSQANAVQANADQANADQAKAGQGITVVDYGTISPLDPKGFHRKGGSIQNSSKKRFNFRANTKNNYSALSKVISIKKNNKTKKSRKKKNKTKKFYKKKKNKRQTKKR
jgi:hypothetical protein